MLDEKTPLLQDHNNDGSSDASHVVHKRISLPRRISQSISETLRVIVSTILAPGRYLIACFYDEDGHFSAALPVYRLKQKVSRKSKKRRKYNAHSPKPHPGKQEHSETPQEKPSEANTMKEESEMPDLADTPSRNTRSKSTSSMSSDSESTLPKRSIRIKTTGEEALRQRKQRRGQQIDSMPEEQATMNTETLADTLKSPTRPFSPSRMASMTKYPRAPAPPRPLIPKRQPSYTYANPSPFGSSQKTLILDLDETLIHSMAKGGRMSTGHMVEVKLHMPVGMGGSILGPQVPILYYVHKRPHCDEFLRKVSKWFNLIVFTASVQEYADPVIDWLELERKYFSARYYRQHCTFKNGAYIKDLSQVEPDLSKVMILDNSPVSYCRHLDNAIPIEGWISDPTDNDLLHLIPLFEGLQHLTDVRALLSLRLGEIVMQKVIRRVNLAKSQAARKKQILEERRTAFERDQLNKINFQKGVERSLVKRRAKNIRREAWELGALSPLNSPALLNSKSYGAWSTTQFNQPKLAKADQRKDFFITTGDRVCVVKGHETDKGKIAEVLDVDHESDTVKVAGVNLADTKPRPGTTKISESEIIAIPYDHVRLVYPLPDPLTGVPRDTMIMNMVKRNETFDIFKNETVWDRYLEPQHVRIPWPEKDEQEFIDREFDTFRIDVDNATFLPSLLRPPMPLGVIDELRKRTSKFRDRHDPEYIQRKVAEDEAEQAEKDRVNRLIPRGARNVARLRRKTSDTDPNVHLSNFDAQAIGEYMSKKKNEVSIQR